MSASALPLVLVNLPQFVRRVSALRVESLENGMVRVFARGRFFDVHTADVSRPLAVGIRNRVAMARLRAEYVAVQRLERGLSRHRRRPVLGMERGL